MYWKRHVCPFDSTRRSLLNQLGSLGEYFMMYRHSAMPMAIIPIAPPGWPPLNCWHRSATRRRRVLRTNSCSDDSSVKLSVLSIFDMASRPYAVSSPCAPFELVPLACMPSVCGLSTDGIMVVCTPRVVSDVVVTSQATFEDISVSACWLMLVGNHTDTVSASWSEVGCNNLGQSICHGDFKEQLNGMDIYTVYAARTSQFGFLIRPRQKW